MTLTMRMTSMTSTCAICKAKGGPFWTHNTEDCRALAGFKKKKQRATHGMTKKEFYASVITQWKRFIEGKNKDNMPEKAKDSNESSVTLNESSDSEN